MPFDPSLGPDITESIPMDVSARAELFTTYANSTLKYDVAIGGMPFLLAISPQNPYQRQTADFRKQQIDTSNEAGEQTFDQWWTRSQDSWHRGEGINFYEPGSDAGTQYRYAHGVGVDVWTKGQATLLHAMDQVATVTTGQSAFVTTGKTGSYFTVENGTVTRHDGAVTAFTGATATCPAVLAGSTLIVGAADGIYTGAASGSTLTKTYTSTAAIRPWWVKSRILAAIGPDLYELALNPPAPPAALPTAFYTHPLPGWTWTAVADAPGAILAAGSDDGHSAIYRFALQDAGSGSTPTLGQAYQVAEFPPGETVTALAVYLGQYLGIVTTRGIRIGLVGSDGSIQYGPLIVQTDEPVLEMEGRGSFIYAAVTRAIDGKSGAVRINLGEGGLENDELRFAYAWDVQTHTAGDCTSIGFIGGTDRVVLGVTGEGIYAQSDTTFEANAYITSGRIRYATSELQAFRQVRVSAHATVAGEGVRIFMRDENDVESFVIRLTSDTGTTQDVTLSQTAPQSNMTVRLQLEPSSDGLASPRLDAMLVKAVPSIVRQRLVSIPIQIFDMESDRYNAKFMRDGFAAKRLFALEQLETAHATVSVQDFTSGESFEGWIEQINFTRTSAPSKQRSGYGGIATVIVRKLA
jgi:hypothetical protein